MGFEMSLVIHWNQLPMILNFFMKLKLGCRVNLYSLRDLDIICHQTLKIPFCDFLLRKWFAWIEQFERLSNLSNVTYV